MTVWQKSTFSFLLGSAYSKTSVSLQAILDVDGDRDLDIVAFRNLYETQHTGVPLTILRNNGGGNFSDATASFFPGGSPKSILARFVAIADVNGDDRPDLFIGNTGRDRDPFPGEANQLLLSKGAHGFVNGSSRLPDVKNFAHSVTAGDIDGDDDVDLLAMTIYGGTPPGGPAATDPHFLINNGSGFFAVEYDRLPTDIQNRTPEHIYTDSLLFDADHDSDLDLFLGSGGDSAAQRSVVLLNPGNGDFSAASPIELPNGKFGRTVVVDSDAIDLNADGALDLILTTNPHTYNGRYFQFLINDGAGNFSDETAACLVQPSTTGKWIFSGITADLNNDGFIDLIAEEGGPKQHFHMNDGTGHFVTLPLMRFEAGLRDDARLAVFDTDRDGRTDVVIKTTQSNGRANYEVWRQKDAGASQSGTTAADGLLGDGSPESLAGLAGNDVVFGGRGGDTLRGAVGNDYLNGGTQNDSLFGDAGRDRLAGGRNKDAYTGGSGADRFMFNAANESAVGAARDVIRDFHRGEGDKVQLSFIDADRTTSFDQAFVFIGTQSFADYATANPGTIGMVRFEAGILQGNVNADLAADFEVRLIGLATMIGSDLVL